MPYPFFYQLDAFDCGPTCLKIVSKYYKRNYDLSFLRDKSYITKNGVSLLGISQAAEEIGFRTLMISVTLDLLISDCPLPAILHWSQDHFIVLYDIKDSNSIFGLGGKKRKFVIGDPGHGISKLNENDFKNLWIPNNSKQGFALILEPSDNFYKKNKDHSEKNTGLLYLKKYVRPYKNKFYLLGFYLLLTTSFTILFPYLTKNMVDDGIGSKNYSLVLLITIFQLVLFASSSLIDILRSWLLLKVNTKISLSIISDFLKKIMSLPIRFFDSKSIGDLSQRLNDHHRIEGFLTEDVIRSIFSVIQIVIFSFILLFYKFSIWLVFTSLSVLGVLWIFLFRKKREKLDYLTFSQNKLMQDKMIELIVGMPEIKLYGSENSKRWEWEFLQHRHYKLNSKGLKLDQYRQNGFSFFSFSKNIIITYLSSVYVIEGKLTFGILLSISFILGQTNGPLQQLVQFFKSAQDAKLSLNRLTEVFEQKNENEELRNVVNTDLITSENFQPENIVIENLDFQYQGPKSRYVLKNINMKIPKGRITAIVGTSGSGKTTLMKLLLGFYTPANGKILIGTKEINSYAPNYWRMQCGTVMQDSFIFSDTIGRNIALDGQEINQEQFSKAIRISKTEDFLEELPQGVNTKIGGSGIGLSGGQKQRIFIARTVYKNPHYLFFDEATSNMDANNEKDIMDNLNTFFKDKTVLIIAHRLSTVRNADNIVVLEKGEIIEEGNHNDLIKLKGKYYALVKNQIEI
jgi:ATP-binding cassette, subfamily B, bacterial